MQKITQDPKNVRIHDEANRAAISRSLQELGAGRSILIDKNGVVIGGNGVMSEAEKLGIPVKIIETDGSTLIAVKRNDLSTDDPKRKALAIADNRTNDLSLFDDEALLDLLAECDNLQVAAGFTPEQQAELAATKAMLDDLQENGFAQTIKVHSDVFSVTFVFPKVTGQPVLDAIKAGRKKELTEKLIQFSGEVQNA